VLFEYFDRLLLLGKGGKVTYFGNIGDNSRVLLDYFERNGARRCTPEENPAEYPSFFPFPFLTFIYVYIIL
jgi:ATP-binding cassette subfamily G (WHITE) protein 2 (SNQ2)